MGERGEKGKRCPPRTGRRKKRTAEGDQMNVQLYSCWAKTQEGGTGKQTAHQKREKRRGTRVTQTKLKKKKKKILSQKQKNHGRDQKPEATGKTEEEKNMRKREKKGRNKQIWSDG